MTVCTQNNNYDVFISYRRDGGEVLAKLLYETLRREKYSVFLDYESLSAGEFGEKILNTIRTANDVLVVLSKDCLKRCRDPKDWMYQEIAEAIRGKKNVIPVIATEFEMPGEAELQEYPEEIRAMLRHQGYHLSIEYYDNVVQKLRKDMLSKPSVFDEDELHRAVSFLLKNGVDNLSTEEQDGLIDKMLTHRYGTKIAEATASFVHTAPRYYNNVRLRFRYEISIDSAFRFGSLEVDEERYYKLTETLSYQKHLLNGEVGREFWISYVRDLDKLDDSLRDENYIFSENLLMEKEDLQKLIALDKEEQITFYTRQMRARFNLNGTVLPPAELIINDAGIFAKYIAEEELSHRDVLDVKLAFSIPHRKGSSYFFASISDPTYSPYISFTYPEDEVDVEMISFMNRNTTTAGAKIFDGLREVSFHNEWVLPMSGAVFILTPHTQ